MAALLLDSERVLGDWCYIDDGVVYLYRMGFEDPDNEMGTYDSIDAHRSHLEPLAQVWLDEQLSFRDPGYS